MSNCTCVYADYSDDLAEFYWLSNPKARKVHKCYDCKREIQPGQIYYRDTGKWDGKLKTYKMCIVCREIIDEFFCDGFAYGQINSDLYEHIQEMDGKISESCLASLSKDARELVCNLIEEYWASSERWVSA